MTVDETLGIAQAHHQAGRLSEAEALYRQVLAADMENIPAMRGFAGIASQVNRPDVAAQILSQALTINP